MTIYYVTAGAWGSGVGSPLAAAQVDGNFYDVDQRIVDLTTDLAEGKRIDFVTYTDTAMTFHYTDATSQVIPLPIATLSYVGNWANSTAYVRGNLITADGNSYQVMVDHTTPSSPTPFDPNATDGTTDNNPLYQLWVPIYPTLDSLTDVEISTGLTEGQVLGWDGDNWINQTPSAASLDDLTDVEVSTSPTEGDILAFSGGFWINTTLSGITPTALDDLTDVTITTAATGQPLVWDGSTWINKSVADLPILNSGSVSGSFTISLQTNEFIRFQMTGNCIVTGFTWPTASSGQFVRRIIEITNTGTFSWTWLPAVKWPQGIDPTQTTNGIDVYAVYSYDGGLTIFGSVVGQNYS